MSGLSRRILRKAKNRTSGLVREMKRVAVLVPMGDMVHSGFAFSLVHMVKHTMLAMPDDLEAFSVQGYGTSILPFSREELARYALDHNATHTLWIDSDMEFPSDMLLRFLKHDKPIIGINATSRRFPHRNTAQTKPGVEIATRSDSTGLERVERMGFGVAWVSTDVFKAMQEPWFAFEFIPENKCTRGEDHFFSIKAIETGFELFVDHDISKDVKHLGTFGYNPVLKSIAGGFET